jgi:hypothetical protein
MKGDVFMADGESIVITAYGHNEVIDKITVSLFDKSASGYGYITDSNAETYCDNINIPELQRGEAWVFARIISENTEYELSSFLPLRFNILLKFDDKVICKLLREIDAQELATALKGENEMIQEKMFKNMSERATRMMKEDMKSMGPVRRQDVEKEQNKILSIIRHFEKNGELIIPYPKGGMEE